MRPDATTLKDLSFFTASGDNLFTLLDFTTTHRGRDALRRHISHPPSSYEALVRMQENIRFFAANPNHWDRHISNGTLVMLDKFFESTDGIATPPSGLASIFGDALLRLFSRQEYFFTQFSLSHLADFLKGCSALAALAHRQDLPPGLRLLLQEMQVELQNMRYVSELIAVNPKTPFRELASLAFAARRELKNPIGRLMQQYATLDAWQSMALATTTYNWIFPDVRPAFPVHFIVKGLYHPLLAQPVSYDLDLSGGRRFLLLTGANMSGKTTFLRAIGVAAILAHLGMGVPALHCELSFVGGVVTNMHVEDNLLRGESYFYAEVQRMKGTAQHLLQPLPHFILMDELFKGTNVQDAYECTRAVIEGLLMHHTHLMILSTHLHEVVQQFTNRPDIIFAFFVTNIREDNSYSFTYQLREGVSNDRIGYRMLQREGVIDILHQKREA